MRNHLPVPERNTAGVVANYMIKEFQLKTGLIHSGGEGHLAWQRLRQQRGISGSRGFRVKQNV
jgi:hypothetical protein